MTNLDRRKFIFGAASVAALPFVPDLGIRPAVAEDSRLIFKAIMDDVNNFAEYSGNNAPSISDLMSSGNSPAISTGIARTGNKALRCLLNRSTSSNSYRTEVTTAKNQLEFFKTHWIGFSIYVPPDWTVSKTYEVIWQLHNQPTNNQWHNFSPVLGIRIQPNSDKWLIQQDYVQAPEGQHQSSDLRRGFSGTYGEVARGAWTDFVIEYCPDWRSLQDGGIGVTRIWRNGTQIVNYKGPNAVNEKNTPYIKFGVYKGAWKDRSFSDAVVQRLYYFDEFRVSRANQGSYDIVAPGAAQGSPARPDPPTLTEIG